MDADSQLIQQHAAELTPAALSYGRRLKQKRTDAAKRNDGSDEWLKGIRTLGSFHWNMFTSA
jgi:hypothetical protein